MPTRLCTSADLARACEILVAAFWDAAVIGAYLHPHREQYPEDLRRFFLRQLRSAHAHGQPDDILLVSHADGEERIISGFAYWRRKRTVPLSRSWYGSLRIGIVDLYNVIETYFWPDRALDPIRASKLRQAAALSARYWSGHRAEVWHLDLLAVDPTRSGHGYGRELVAWGFQQAKAEGVGCSVTAAPAQVGFYRGRGFDVEVGNIKDGVRNPLRGEAMPGGVVMFWDNGRVAGWLRASISPPYG